jgi:hypothetical protein
VLSDVRKSSRAPSTAEATFSEGIVPLSTRPRKWRQARGLLVLLLSACTFAPCLSPSTFSAALRQLAYSFIQKPSLETPTLAGQLGCSANVLLLGLSHEMLGGDDRSIIKSYFSIGKNKAREPHRGHYVPKPFPQTQAQLCCFVCRICGRISQHSLVKACLSFWTELEINDADGLNAGVAIQRNLKGSSERNAIRFRFFDGR